MARIAYTRPYITSYQKAILDSPARYTVTEAATKVGKTASHVIWLFEESLRIKENQSVWWVAPIFAQAEIAYNRMKAQVTDRNFFKANDTKLLLTLPTGAKIHFRSAERPDSLFGDDVYAAVMDEFTRTREEAWHALRSTLTATKGRCKFIGNVKGKKNWGYRMAMRAKAGEPDYEYFKITAYDAAQEGIIELEEIEQAKRDLPETVFQELYLAEPSEDGSNPFGLQHIEQCKFPISTMPAVCFGVDLAKSTDHTVIIGLDQFGSVCHLQRFQMDWRQTVHSILALPNVPMRMDSTGVGDPIVEEIQRHRNNVTGIKFNQWNKQQMMEGLALSIQQRKISFPPSVITDELEQFEFVYTRTGVKYSAPEGLHDDAVCALALANECHKTAVSFGNYSWA